MRQYTAQKISGRLILIFSLYILIPTTTAHAIEAYEYLLKTGAQVATCAVEIPSSLELGSTRALTKHEQNSLLSNYRHAARMAGEFSSQYGNAVIRGTMPTRLIVLDNPAKVALATHRPEYDRLGHVVARIDLIQGLVYLSRLSASDLYMELGKWFFYETDYQWGQSLKADLEHQFLIKRFAVFCVAQQELTIDTEDLNSFQLKTTAPEYLTYFSLKPTGRYLDFSLNALLDKQVAIPTRNHPQGY